MIKYLYTSLLLMLYGIPCSYGQIKLPAFFSSNMVLQQKADVKIWGTAAANEKISIKTSWNDQQYKVQADTVGKWIAAIRTPAAGGPYSVAIHGKNKILLENILIGEVWLCSGQSNMDMPVKGYWNSPVLNSNDWLLNAPNHRIRLFHIAKKTAASPLTDVEGKWEEANVASVKDFSAVGYRFGYLLNKHLEIPVGMIQATWGGSPIEAWMDTTTLAQVAQENRLSGGATTQQPHQTPAYLFNGMIAPLTGYGMAGVLWYQGEQNRYNAKDYFALQPAMVKAWRKKWEAGDWPFFYVQVAPMRYPASQRNLVPAFREVQLKLAGLIPNSGMAVSIDAGDENNIHPGKKELIAKRLAYLALSKTYGKTGLDAVGPQYKSLKISHDTLSVAFANAPLGLTSFGNPLTRFEIAGKDKVFHTATAFINGANIALHSDAVPEPVAVCYAYTDWATGELYGTNGLPVSSFRTDDW